MWYPSAQCVLCARAEDLRCRRAEVLVHPRSPYRSFPAREFTRQYCRILAFRLVEHEPIQMLAQGSSAMTLEASVIATFNQKLVAKAASFAANNTGASTYTYDSNAKVTQILNNPTAYGLVDATSYGDVVNDAWCTSSDLDLIVGFSCPAHNYPFSYSGNNYHISPPVHTLLAADIQTILKSAGFLAA